MEVYAYPTVQSCPSKLLLKSKRASSLTVTFASDNPKRTGVAVARSNVCGDELVSVLGHRHPT